MTNSEEKPVSVVVTDSTEETNRGMALGLCFGAGIGIIVGAILNHTSMGFTICSVIGVLGGLLYDSIHNRKIVQRSKI